VKPSQLKRRNKRRDDRARPELPPASPDVFPWRPMVEPVFGPTPRLPAAWVPQAAEPREAANGSR
jgi:hypothetical protein